MKKVISLMLAIMLTVLCAVPAFAATDELNLADERYDLRTDAENAMYYYLYNNRTLGTYPYPIWSDATAYGSEALYEEIKNAPLETLEEIQAERAKLDKLYAEATVDSSELEFMIELFEKEDNSNKYYDEATWSEFLSVLENGKNVLKNGTDEEIHIAYVTMRNEFNKICLYNKTMGDINNDNSVDIKDVTYLQKAISGTEKLNSSQLTVACVNENLTLKPDVKAVTTIQKRIADIDLDDKSYGKHLIELENLGELPYYPKKRMFIADTDRCNVVYHQNMYESRTFRPST